MNLDSKAGFVAIVGRSNAGKSTFLNSLINEQIALVSHKINATRRRMNIIVMHENAQIIFIDTPGIHKAQKRLNLFMQDEYSKALESCDFAIFIAPASDDISAYEEFINKYKKNHILILSKIDLIDNSALLSRLKDYQRFDKYFKAIIPISSLKKINLDLILKEIAKNLPPSPYFYDTDLITTQNLKEIYKEKIRESIFENINQEIPYQSDVIVEKVAEGEKIEKIFAKIIVEKESQRIILIGKNGRAIKNIGIKARKKIEDFIGKKVFLRLEIVVIKGWLKDKRILKELGF